MLNNSKDVIKERLSPDTPVHEDLIPLIEPEITGNEWTYIKECLDKNWVSSSGAFVDRFEHIVAEYVGTKYGVATVNGTTALHAALLAAGIQPGDEVLVSSLTFIAPANAIRYIGAFPVFMDAELEHRQMDPRKVVEYLDEECVWSDGELRNKITHRRIKAIIPVHILGHPVEMNPIMEVAEKYNLIVIEDAAQSLGANYNNERVGRLGHVSCLSFNGNKIVTAGSGGMILTDDEKIARKARYLTTQAKDDPIEYYHEETGYNYRLSNLLSAMGVAQMENLDKYVEKKRAIAARYNEYLGDLEGITIPQEAEWAFSTYWMYTILIDPVRCGFDSRAVLKKLAKHNIQSRPLWRPLPDNKPFHDCQAYRIEAAYKLHFEALCLPSSVGLTTQQQERVIQTLIDVFTNNVLI